MSTTHPRAKLIEEAWYMGRIRYMLHGGQRKITETFSGIKGQLFVANISRQFGKSFWAVNQAVELCLNNPKSRVKYATAFETDLTELIMPTFEKVLADCPEYLKPVYKTKGSKWVFRNGSEIKLIGLDKRPNALRGNTIDMIILDEAGFIGNLPYIYKSIIIPATLHRPNCKIILISTPPATPAHPFVDFVQKAKLENAYVEMTIYENPLITQADIDRMAHENGGYESTTFQREFLCRFVLDDDLALVRNWSEEFELDIPRDEYYRYYYKYVAMDMGRSDLNPLLFGYYDYKRAALIVEDEVTMKKDASWNTVTLKDEILKKEKELWGEQKPFRRIADNNNPHLIIDLGSLHNVHFAETDKESLDAMVNEVRIMVNNGQIIVSPKCQMLIGCLKFGIWDNKHKGFARSAVYGHHDHFAALVYMVRNLAKNTNPIPADHGLVNHKAWLHHIKENINANQNAKKLRDAILPKKTDIFNTLNNKRGNKW